MTAQPYIERDCAFSVNGQHVAVADGAYVSDARLRAYLGPEGETEELPVYVVDWHGKKLGFYHVTKRWTYRVPASYRVTMLQVRITLWDGRRYQGRSQGPGCLVTARRVASDRRTQ